MPSWNEQANSIFVAAAEIADAEQRAKFVEQSCHRDRRLLERVLSLLNAEESLDDFLLEPALTTESPRTSAVDLSGTVIDRYKILEKLGEGGFGTVYMAEQKEPVKRRVALKVIKPGMDTREVIARFEAERQVLAIMEHPNIAKVIDAGETTSGHPFFVMELVHGLPITEFCNENRLDTGSRLELFETLCQAVQHAHQRAIIHRDIKPSNVMVSMLDGKPIVKVIDFGIAKATNRDLTDKTLFTRYGRMVGTPQYMSPEQAGYNAADIDTRSDVYSLGVLLYELLTGTTPLDATRLKSSMYEEVRRIIREEEPPIPSVRISSFDVALKKQLATQRDSDEARLQQRVTGELDWMVMRALEKDRNCRYESASAFARDVRRHLNGEVVQASPPSWRYLARKFVRRNQMAIGLTLFVGVSLLISTVIASVGLIRESHANMQLEEKNALLELQNAKIAEDYLFQAIAAGQNGQEGRAELLVEKARELGARPADIEVILGTIRSTFNNEVARHHFRRAIKLAPTSNAPWSGLAMVSLDCGDTKGFFEGLGGIRRNPPKNAMEFGFSAQVLSILGDYETATEFARRGLELHDSATIRSNAAIAFANAALAKNDMQLAQQAMDCANDVSTRLGPDHFTALGMRMQTLNAMIVLKKKHGEECDSYLSSSKRLAAKLYGQLDRVTKLQPGMCHWLSCHYEFFENDSEKAEQVHETLMRNRHSELVATMFARFLLGRYGKSPCLKAFQTLPKLDSGKRTSWSQHLELVVRARSDKEEDRQVASKNWRQLGEESVGSREFALCVAALLGENDAMKLAAEEWAQDEKTTDRNFARFASGEINEQEYLSKSRDRILSHYCLAHMAHARGDFSAEREHFKASTVTGNHGNWPHLWSTVYLAQLEHGD